MAEVGKDTQEQKEIKELKKEVNQINECLRMLQHQIDMIKTKRIKKG